MQIVATNTHHQLVIYRVSEAEIFPEHPVSGRIPYSVQLLIIYCTSVDSNVLS